MTVARYALGLVALALVVGSLGIAADALRRRYLPYWTGATAWLAGTVIGLALLVLILELLGTVGLFRLGPIVAASVLCGAVLTRACMPAGGFAPGALRARRLTASTAIVLIAGATLIAEWAGPTLSSYEFGIRGFDSLWYHLPWAASFAQTGQITSFRFTDVEYLTAFYPAISELLHGLGIVLLGRDTLSPGLNLFWLALVLLAGYCVGRPRKLGHATMLGAALAMATPTMTLSQAGSAANDVVGIFFLLAAVAFVAGADGRRAALALAGVAAGLAIAVKLSLLAPVLALMVAAIWSLPVGRRRAGASTWMLALLLAGGFWYLRNLIAVGNPLPWIDLPGLATPAPAIQQHTAFTVVHYLTDTSVWSKVFWPALKDGLGVWWPAILIAALIGPILCLSPRAGRTVRVLGVVALVSLLAYVLTPESAAGPAGHPTGFAFNLRYLSPGLALSLTLLPLAPALSTEERRRRVTVAVLALLLLATLTQARLWPSRQLLGAIAIGVAVLGVGWSLTRDVRLPRPAILVAVLIPVVLAGAAAGYAWQQRYLRGRYAFQPGISYLGHLWALFRGVRHARVALVGTYGGFFSYPLFGLDDSNRVQYVAHRGAHGSFTQITSCAQWRAALNAGRYRYVVTTPARDPWRRKRLTRSPEGAWTASDPAALRVYSRRATGQVIALYELRGPLHPGSCP